MGRLPSPSKVAGELEAVEAERGPGAPSFHGLGPGRTKRSRWNSGRALSAGGVQLADRLWRLLGRPLWLFGVVVMVQPRPALREGWQQGNLGLRRATEVIPRGGTGWIVEPSAPWRAWPE